MCVFRKTQHSFTLTDPQVEVQIRILLKEAAIKSKCKHQQSHFDFLNNAYWGFFFLVANQDMFLIQSIQTFYYCVPLSCII
jgi:hypothetical protein